jgi:hypothetical protein
MSVAYTLNGEPIAYPANVIALRAKRMKAKGAPELLYKDGVPLALSPDGDIAAEVREHIGDQFEDGELVRIKLEPIDERGRIVEDVPAAYVQFSAPRMYRPPVSTELPTSTSGGDLAVVQEAMRLNAAMAQTAMAKLPAIMEAAARLLAAADGAGLPARAPVVLAETERNGVEEAEPEVDERPRNATADIIHGVSKVLASAEPFAKLANTWLGGRAATRNAAVVNDNGAATQAPPTAATNAAHDALAGAAPAPPSTAPSGGTPKDLVSLMAHMEAVKGRLTDEERAIAEAAASEMSPDEMMHSASKLGPLSVDDAVAEVRRMIGAAS